jgi:two-component system, LytTR family, response regulator
VTQGPWRIVAIDDEPPALRALGRALASAVDFTLSATTSDPMSAVSLIRETEPDVIMLDIQMPGLTGFDIVRELRPTVPALVFLTAYDQYAVQAFDAQAIDYLLKPINPTRLAETLERLRRQLSSRAGHDMLPRLEALLATLDARPAPVATTATRISLKRNGGTSFIDARTIDRIDSADNEVRISAAGQLLSVRETLTAIAVRLPAGQFLRVHRTCVVNLSRVQHVEPYFHGDVVIHLANGTKVISGRSYRADVRAAFGLSRHTE